jgi:hypothetical protein
MAAATLLALFPMPEGVLALTPEDFGGVIVESSAALWRAVTRPDQPN